MKMMQSVMKVFAAGTAIATQQANAKESQDVCSTLVGMEEIENPDAKVVDGRVFPLTLGPSDPNNAYTDLVSKNDQALRELARQHGAVLLRNFKFDKAEDFADVMENLKLENMPYVGGAAVRRNIVGDRVFTANESPPSEPIPFHHEMAQTANPPRYVAFYCEIAPEKGGETPLILSHHVFKFFQENYPKVCDKVIEQGVKYMRVMPAEDDENSAIGRSWKNTFLVENKTAAENKMRQMGHSWEWLPNDELKTITNIVPAVRSVPGEGDKFTFFNSMVAAFKGWVDSRNDPSKAIMYGDGTPVDPEALEGVWKFMEAEKVAVPWQKRDIVIVDNSVALHSRNTYDSPRRILASVGRSPLAGTFESSKELEKAAVGTPVLTRLYSGGFMPRLGLGTWRLKDAAKSVYEAIQQGVRHIDAAADYGNEVQVGQGIKRAIDEGLVKREDLFVTSKLWNTFHGKHVEEGLNKSLSDLGLDYVDLYLVHFPIPMKYVPIDVRYPPEWIHDPAAENPRVEVVRTPMYETYRNMEKQVLNGRAKAIGVANFNIQQLRDIMSYAKFPPAVLQVELHPLNSQQKLLRFAEENGIQVVAFSPMGHTSYTSLGMAEDSDSILENPVVSGAAKAHGVSSHQVLLRWALQRGTGAVFTSNSPAHMKDNLNAFTFELTDQEMQQLDTLNKNRRFNDPGDFAEKAFNTFLPIYE